MLLSRIMRVLLLFGALSVLGDEVSLVRIGDPWHYRPGTNEPSAPTEAWRQPGFDDSAWPDGPSGFSNIRYFFGLEATFLPSFNFVFPISLYLRRTFTVADPQAVKWLVLRLDYDDGFVAYLNGQEVVRRGLTNDPVPFDEHADYHPGGLAEEFDLSAFTNLLTAGTNVLALQVHTAKVNPPSVHFSLRIVPELLANFQRGPFVQDTSTNHIQVIWRTPVAADSVVEFGTTPSLGSQVIHPALVTDHTLTLTGLLPDTEYYYRVRSTSGGVTAVSPVFTFHTLKMSGDFSFLVVGDSGGAGVAPYQLAALMQQSPADLVLHVGDPVYQNFYFGREDYRCLSVYGRQMRSVPFFFTVGNHDIEGGSLAVAWLDTFRLPTNSVTGTSHYYSFDHGDAHFVSLYVPSLGFPPDGPWLAAYTLSNGSPQYCWLTNDLAASTKPWKLLMLHVPMVSSGRHFEDDDNANGRADQTELQEMLLPLAKRYGVQMMFSGHDHEYERFNPVNGVHVIVSGGGGGELYLMAQRHAASAQLYRTNHFARVTVRGDTLTLQAVDTNGVVFDSMTIQRTLPPPQLYEAAWNTPLVESSPADDNRGNIRGQTFNLTGTPILPLSGDFSNLGRVLVNNDSTNLFIGFDQAMIYSNDNIYLFIESPRQSGVTNLIGLGDGLADTSEGVDGLDFLENLSFTNFTPSIAALLGDEYADSQSRHFIRSNSILDIGQGVFRLARKDHSGSKETAKHASDRL